MGIDFSGFKDFTPQRRASELQKLIDTLKKEIESRQEDIKTAERMLALADEEARVLEQVEVPEARAPARRTKEIEERVEIKTAEKETGKRLTREERVELERLLATAPPRSEQVLHQVAHRPVQELYGELRRIYDRQSETGVERAQDREMIYAIRKGLEIKKEEGYKPAARDRHLMTAAEQMAENMYQGGAGTYKRGTV
jgi:hypothetical protein